MSNLKTYMNGETIAKEGDRARSLFILYQGRIGIFKDGKQIAEFDKEGTIVGEMSLILEKLKESWNQLNKLIRNLNLKVC